MSLQPEDELPLDLGESESSLLDLVDHLLDKGCVLTGSLTLGLANVDLIAVELSLLVCAADRLRPPPEDA